MNNKMLFVCFHEMSEKEFWDFRKIMTERYVATDHLSGLKQPDRIAAVYKFEKVIFDIVRKHKGALQDAGYDETRGDNVHVQPSSAFNRLSVFVTPGDAVLPKLENSKSEGKTDDEIPF